MRIANTPNQVTRGYGACERFLATRRAHLADKLIPSELREGLLIDIGCGAWPLFLCSVKFHKRIGIDKTIDKHTRSQLQGMDLTVIPYDAERYPSLPFASDVASAITLLAVMEHMEKSTIGALFLEIKRVLKKGGLFIVTTPAAWTRPILTTLSKMRLVSPAEIAEHKHYYTRKELHEVLLNTGFEKGNIQSGVFELGCNLWATARK